MSIKSTLSRYTILLLIAASALIVLSLSWPRLRASVRYLPVDTAMSKYWQSGEANTPQLDALIERAKQAITLHDHHRYWGGLSELQILSGQDKGKPYWQRRQLLEQAVVSAQAVVERAPANPRAWLRIARTRAFLGAPVYAVIPAWKMSILTGRVEPTLMLTRLELGLAYFDLLDDEAVSLLRDQALLTWAINRKSVLKSLKNGSMSIDLIRQLLAGRHRDIIADMEAYVGKAG